MNGSSRGGEGQATYMDPDEEADAQQETTLQQQEGEEGKEMENRGNVQVRPPHAHTHTRGCALFLIVSGAVVCLCCAVSVVCVQAVGDYHLILSRKVHLYSSLIGSSSSYAIRRYCELEDQYSLTQVDSKGNKLPAFFEELLGYEQTKEGQHQHKHRIGEGQPAGADQPHYGMLGDDPFSQAQALIDELFAACCGALHTLVMIARLIAYLCSFASHAINTTNGLSL
jgi:hypothetical protein